MGTVTTLPRGRPMKAADPVAAAPARVRAALRPARPAQPRRLLVLAAPTDVRLADDTVLQPDLLVIDPDALELIAWELGADGYVEVAHVIGDAAYAATEPFPLELVPSALIR